MLCVGSKIYRRTSVCSVTLCLACQVRCIAGGQYAVSPSYDSSTLCLACQVRCIAEGQYIVSLSWFIYPQSCMPGEMYRRRSIHCITFMIHPPSVSHARWDVSQEVSTMCHLRRCHAACRVCHVRLIVGDSGLNLLPFSCKQTLNPYPGIKQRAVSVSSCCSPLDVWLQTGAVISLRYV